MKTLSELQNLNGKWALITGGCGHVGQAACETLLELGASVILIDKQQPGTSNIQNENVHYFACDLASESAIDSVLENVKDLTNNQLSIVINNAAFVGTSQLSGWTVPFEQQSLDTWKQCLDVNLSAPFYLVQQCMPLFEQTLGDKSVINVSSIYGLVGPQMAMYKGTNMGSPAAYAASKGGLIQLTHWLAPTLAPKIRVNSLVLGGIERGQADSFLAQYNSRVPMERMATEEDVKGAIAYLSSGLSKYMTGQSLILDGGWTTI